MDEKPNTKIVSLEASNVKRLNAVRIEPSGNMIIIGGKNGAGKTSVLDSIEYALGGSSSLPQKPLKDGQTEGYVVLETESLVIHRKFTESGTSLTIRDRQNQMKMGSPQSILDKLTGELTFDPLGFSRMKASDQKATLQDLIGLNFDMVNAKQKDLTDQRKIVGREEKAITAKLGSMVMIPDVPEEEVSVVELSQILEDNKEKIREYRLKKERLLALATEFTESEQKIIEITANIGRIKAEGVALKKEVADIVLPDVEEIKLKIQNSEEVNRNIRINKDIVELTGDAEEKHGEYVDLTAEIKQIDKDKELAIHEAHMPVDGLGFDDNGVAFNGMPFDQCSGAEQLKISIAMGIALNPELKILLIRDGSLLDEESLKVVGQMAEDNSMQVWLEKVGEGKECSVVIEDGEVKK